MSGSLVLCIWSATSRLGRENLEHAFKTRAWGFRKPPLLPDGVPGWALFGRQHTAGSPRVTRDVWQGGELEVVLCELVAGPRKSVSFHWSDEFIEEKVIYPYRIGIVPVGVAQISASPGGPLGPEGTEAMRLASIKNSGVPVRMDLAGILDRLGVPMSDATGQVDLSRTAGDPFSHHGDDEAVQGPSRSQDFKLRDAVERRSVVLAIEEMKKEGWGVRELGKPFDLICTKGDGQEKHVEVKGTTGPGVSVEYTPNEVSHFRTCPYGCDLIVVRDIKVDKSRDPYFASGGQLHRIRNYRADPEDLHATGWLGRVSGWSD